jgi:hypothetical protein
MDSARSEHHLAGYRFKTDRREKPRKSCGYLSGLSRFGGTLAMMSTSQVLRAHSLKSTDRITVRNPGVYNLLISA